MMEAPDGDFVQLDAHLRNRKRIVEMITSGTLPAVIGSFQPDMLRAFTEVMNELCMPSWPVPPISSDIQSTLLRSLAVLIGDATDTETLVDTLPSLSTVVDHDDVDQTQIINDSGILANVIPLLSHADDRVRDAALLAVDKSFLDAHKQLLPDFGVLQQIRQLLREPNGRYKKVALCLLANITAGDCKQIQAVLDDELIPIVAPLLAPSEHQTQIDAARALLNVTLNGNETQMAFLVEQNVLKPLCCLLRSSNAELVGIILTGLNNWLKIAKHNRDIICQVIDLCGGLDIIKSLQYNDILEIKMLALSIIDEHVPAELLNDGLEDDDYAHIFVPLKSCTNGDVLLPLTAPCLELVSSFDDDITANDSVGQMKIFNPPRRRLFAYLTELIKTIFGKSNVRRSDVGRLRQQFIS